ncbi:hypothetical protein [Hyphomicrobium sp.]|uniref:hypothetical protein n=1 Tax=Hyphomicrobium sp. TaxID=82 RepID=UPI002FE2AFC8
MARKTREEIDKDRMLAQQLRKARKQFIKRFGREPREGDPLLWDEDAPGDEPVPMTEEKLRRQMLDNMAKAGTPGHLIYAFEKTGLIVDDAGYRRLSADDRAAWDNAMAEYEAMEKAQRRKPQ